jgi:hypothetical protein
VSHRGPVPAPGVTVVGYFTRDGGGRSTQPSGDRAQRFAGSQPEGDFLAFGESQAAAFEVSAPAGAHTTGFAQPLQSSPAMSAGHRGGVGEELTGLQRRPERLVQLGDKLVGEANGHQRGFLTSFDGLIGVVAGRGQGSRRGRGLSG